MFDFSPFMDLWNDLKNKIKILKQGELNLRPNDNISRNNLQERKESGYQFQHTIFILGDECGHVACLVKEHLTNFTVSAVVKARATFEDATFGIEKYLPSFGEFY